MFILLLVTAGQGLFLAIFLVAQWRKNRANLFPGCIFLFFSLQLFDLVLPSYYKALEYPHLRFWSTPLNLAFGPILYFYITGQQKDSKPGPVLLKLSCPFLALHGDQDPFVSPDKNLEAIANRLQKGGNQQFKSVKLPNVNHVFQDATNGSPAAYSNNENSFSPSALRMIHQWLAEVLDLN